MSDWVRDDDDPPPSALAVKHWATNEQKLAWASKRIKQLGSAAGIPVKEMLHRALAIMRVNELTQIPVTAEKFIEEVAAVWKPRAEEPPTPPNPSYLTKWVTLTGIPLGDVPTHINKKFPPNAVPLIKGMGRFAEGKTNLLPVFAFERMNEVFGLHGVGWRLMPDPALGGLREETELKRVKGDKGEYDRTIYVATLQNYRLEYVIVYTPNHQKEWVYTSLFSASNANDIRNYAVRGAFSSLLKEGLRMVGLRYD